MKIAGIGAVVTGGGSGLGAASASLLAKLGAKVAVVDFNEKAATAVASQIGGVAIPCDVSSAEQCENAFTKIATEIGNLRVLVNCAGIGPAEKILGRSGLMALDAYRRVIEINLIGTFNFLRLFASQAAELEPLPNAERGVIINTASVAAFEGQIGQTAYASSKGGVVALTLPAARELASLGIRVCAIAPGIFETAMLNGLPRSAQESLGQQIPFPSRLGHPDEFALLVQSIINNPMLNGEVIRLDGAIRMAPK